MYLGVSDEGRIIGLRLSQYQRDHVMASMIDLMSRYKPRIDLQFVPVVDKDKSFVCSKLLENIDRFKSHLLRTYKNCWCDKSAIEQFLHGVKQAHYELMRTT